MLSIKLQEVKRQTSPISGCLLWSGFHLGCFLAWFWIIPFYIFFYCLALPIVKTAILYHLLYPSDISSHQFSSHVNLHTLRVCISSSVSTPKHAISITTSSARMPSIPRPRSHDASGMWIPTGSALATILKDVSTKSGDQNERPSKMRRLEDGSRAASDAPDDSIVLRSVKIHLVSLTHIPV